VDEIGGGLREAGDSSVASSFGGLRDFGELGEIGDIGTGSEPIEIFFVQFGTNGVEFGERHTAGFGSGGFVHKDNGFGFDAKAAMVGKNAGDMNPVSVAVLVGRAAGSGIGDEAKRDTALAIVVDGAETDFVVAFVDRAVVDEFGGVEEMKAIHATAA
jgi:hypothetical protein